MKRFVAALLCAVSLSAFSQEFPGKPIRVLVPFAPIVNVRSPSQIRPVPVNDPIVKSVPRMVVGFPRTKTSDAAPGVPKMYSPSGCRVQLDTLLTNGSLQVLLTAPSQ